MHYIRLLRPATLNTLDRTTSCLSLLFTITTDLGESFFCPQDAIGLKVCLDNGEHYVLPETLDNRPLMWRPGMRVLDAKFRVGRNWAKGSVTVHIFPARNSTTPTAGARHAARASLPERGVPSTYPWGFGNRTFWIRARDSSRGDEMRADLVMPVSITMKDGVCSPPVSLRILDIATSQQSTAAAAAAADVLSLTFEEDMGESIARHIWDAGLVLAAYLGEACRRSHIRDILPIEDSPSGGINILELGSGVGILGITLGGVLGKAAELQGKRLQQATVLLTDLPEAEERARRNISRALEAYEGSRGQSDESPTMTATTVLEYENLSWDDGTEGRLGPLAASRRWDYVVLSDCTYNVDSLPALVGTLGALHDSNRRRGLVQQEGEGEKGEKGEKGGTSSVILATKPRHSSEQALFGLLEAEGWRCRLLKGIPLPRVDGEGQGEGEGEVVEVYLLEKGAGG